MAALAKEVKIEKGDRAADEAERFYKDAGLKLK
jgi:hypothetical protein